jgi:hypothetical protein
MEDLLSGMLGVFGYSYSYGGAGMSPCFLITHKIFAREYTRFIKGTMAMTDNVWL